jgi:large subunit ribosomal protein L9
MKIILLKDIQKFGKKYDIKEVAPGYALNALIPQGLAKVATKENIGYLKEQKKRHDELLQTSLKSLGTELEKLQAIHIEILGKASEKGHLFAGIHKTDIVAALKQKTGLTIEATMLLINEPIKEIGQYEVGIMVGSKVFKFKLTVTLEK